MEQKNLDVRRRGCPKDREIELYLLTGIDKRTRSERTAKHISRCEKCRGVYKALKGFYKILHRELHRPVSSEVLDFIIKTLNPNTRAAVILLSPVQGVSTRGKKLFTVVVFMQIGNEAGISRLSEFKLPNLRPNQLLLRIVEQGAREEAVLSLWAKNVEFFNNVSVQFEHSPQVIFTDASGIAVLPKVDLEQLLNRKAWIRKTKAQEQVHDIYLEQNRLVDFNPPTSQRVVMKLPSN